MKFILIFLIIFITSGKVFCKPECELIFKDILLEENPKVETIKVNGTLYDIIYAERIYVYKGKKLQFRIYTPLPLKVIAALIRSNYHIFKVYKTGNKYMIQTSNEFAPYRWIEFKERVNGK